MGAQSAVLEFVGNQERHFGAIVRVFADQPCNPGNPSRAFFVRVLGHQPDLALIVNKAFGKEPFVGDAEIKLQR